MRHLRNRELLRARTSEERLLAVMVVAALVFAVVAAVELAHTGSGRSAGPGARRHTGAQHAAPPTGSSTAGPGPSSLREPPPGPGVRAPRPPDGASSLSNDGVLPQRPATSALVHMLRVRTVPPLPNVSFSLAGTPFTSDVQTGVALLLIGPEEHDRLLTDPRQELTVTAPAVPLGRGGRAIFAGWGGPVTSDGRFDTVVARFRLAA